jgi:hypothetical protein
MPEHDRRPTAASEGRHWDLDAISRSLHDAPREHSDRVFGAGVRFRLGRQQETDLELFPAAGVVRVTAPDLQLALFGQEEAPTVATAGIVFTRDQPSHRSLAIAAEGTITLAAPAATAAEAAKSVPDAAAPPQRPTHRSVAEKGLTDDPAAPAAASQHALPEPPQTGQPRVAFAGRLGRDPRCRTTPREIRVCTFPVAEKRDAVDTPNWLSVVAFKALAAKVEATLKKGMFVEGVGYQHERERKGRDGATRTGTEIYAVVVTPR